MAGAIKRKRVSLVIEDFLKCRKCCEPIYDPPVYKCANDDLFCRGCYEAIDKSDRRACAFCNAVLTGQRCALAEKILDKLPTVKCKNAGCSKAFAGDENRILHSHVECGYRKVNCVHCEALFGLNELAEHLFKVKGFYPLLHNVYGFGTKATTRFTVDELVDGRGKSRPFTVIVDSSDDLKGCVGGNTSSTSGVSSGGSSFGAAVGGGGDEKRLHFFLNVCRSKGRYMFWVSHGQKKNDLKVWRYTISVLGSSEAKRPEFTFSGYCQPADHSVPHIAEDMNVLNLSTNFQGDNFQGDNKNNIIVLETKIVRVAEKAKSPDHQ